VTGSDENTPVSFKGYKQEMKKSNTHALIEKITGRTTDSKKDKVSRLQLSDAPVNDCVRQQYARIIFKELYKQTRKLLDTRRQR
jgi:hypothetical protein